MEIYKVLGKKTTTTKNGNVGHTYYLIAPFDDYALANAKEIIGSACMEVYTSINVSVKPGDNITISYKPGYQGKAVVSGIEVVEKK